MTVNYFIVNFHSVIHELMLNPYCVLGHRTANLNTLSPIEFITEKPKLNSRKNAYWNQELRLPQQTHSKVVFLLLCIYHTVDTDINTLF